MIYNWLCLPGEASIATMFVTPVPEVLLTATSIPVNVVKLACESALGSSQAVCIALGKEVHCVCSRVDNRRSSYADCVLDIIAESIGRLERRIKSPILNQRTSNAIEDPYNVLGRHKNEKLLCSTSKCVHKRVGIEFLVDIVFIGPNLGPACDLGRVDVMIGQAAGLERVLRMAKSEPDAEYCSIGTSWPKKYGLGLLW